MDIAREREKAFLRLLQTLEPSEAKRVSECYYRNEMTGYATVDRPWDAFYNDIVKEDKFLGTTPYTGLIKGNEGHFDDVAIKYFGSNTTFGQLVSMANAISKSYEEYGVKKGKFVTICSTTTPEVAGAFYGASKIGAAVNLISPFYSPEEFIYRVDECESNLIIMADNPNFMSKFKDVLNKDKRKQVVVLPLMNSSLLRFFAKGYKIDGKTNEISWKSFLADGSYRDDTQVDEYEPNKLMAMVYSSGTSGQSKGILLSVDSFQKLVNAYGNSGFDTSRGLKVFQNIPPWHSTGISLGVNFPLSYGVTVCTDPRFDHKVVVKNALCYQPEYMLTNTSMYQGFTFDDSLKMLKFASIFNKKPLGSLRYAFEGGEPLTSRDVKNIESVFGEFGSSARLFNGYGRCEDGSTITTDITSHKFSDNASGIPLPNITTVGIFDDNYRELQYGVRGNILDRSEIGMIGYYNNPEKTVANYFTDINGDDWSITGDIGFMNEDGSLVVQGRKSDFSVINGEQFYNFDVENAILSSGVVKLCEIQTHPDDSNRLVAHVVWENETKEYLRNNPEKLGDYLELLQRMVLDKMGKPESVPYSFCIRDSFPSAYSGKRDINYIKYDIDDIINLERDEPKKIIK